MNLRPVDPGRDGVAVATIYRAAIETTFASFEEPAPDAAVMAARMRATLERYPWLVAEEDGRVVGYAYAGQHADRAGYRWSVNVSAYVDAAFHGRGIGRRLYDELLPILRRQRFVNGYAGIALPKTRPASRSTRRSACGASAPTSASASSTAGGSTSPGTGCA